jgi:hypothetical protein
VITLARAKTSFDRHNNKGGSRIISSRAALMLADILLAAIFPSPCILAVIPDLLSQEHELFDEYYT